MFVEASGYTFELPFERGRSTCRRRGTMRHIPAAWLILAFMTAGLRGGELYLTTEGAGRRDGADWANALAASAVNEAVNKRLQPGDRLLLAGGDYRDVELVIDGGGKPGAAKEIV